MTSAWVVSDIQGHPDDLNHGLGDLYNLRPDAAGLLLAGDIVETGLQSQWDEIYQVMDDRSDILPETIVAAIGNHERLAGEGWEVLRDRFLEFAERDQVWGEYVLQGHGVEVPVIVIGQDAVAPPAVPMSGEQVDFLDERLDYWTERERQVLVVSHYPLGGTASASWIPVYYNFVPAQRRIDEHLGRSPERDHAGWPHPLPR